MKRAMTPRSFVRRGAAARTRRSARVATSALAATMLSSCALAPVAGAASPNPANWDRSQQRQVLAAGLMQNHGNGFDGAGQLSGAGADQSMVALAARLTSAAAQAGSVDEETVGAASGQGATGETGSTGAQGIPAGTEAPPKPPVQPVRTAQNPVTVITFDRLIVDQLGLGDVAAHVQDVAAASGLRPPSYFGTEVLARFLELRYDHPAGTDRLELFPTDPITRAEAAWSLAQVLRFGTWNVAYAREALSAFALPRMSGAQRQELQIAVSRIGYPYVWGGTTDNTADGLEHGGFDCSGFAWRVFKLSGLPWGQQIQGRTAAEQAGEIPRSQRLRMSQLEPGDLLFFGSARFHSQATERSVVHEGIYLGDNWVIHSSFQGVYVLPLKGSWLGSSFAWGRRVIR
jgi:cell wall-associated NlpC family hydrolase